MFEFYGYLISVLRFGEGLLVRLHEDEQDTEPLEYYTPSRDPYCAAALLKTDLDLMSESEVIQFGELIDANL
jgi:hypothetical protein